MLSKNGRLQIHIHNSFHEGYNESEEGICPSMAGQSVIKCIWDCFRQSRSRCNLLKYSFLFLFIQHQYFILSKNGRLQFQIHILFHEGYNESEEGICPSSAGQSVIKCIWDCCRQSRLRARAKYSFLFCLRNKYLVVVSEKDILTIPKNLYNQL